jgi:hypothetical protein
VGVEKLISAKFAQIKLRQDDLYAIFSGRVDIFYPPKFGGFGLKGIFSTPTGDRWDEKVDPRSRMALS